MIPYSNLKSLFSLLFFFLVNICVYPQWIQNQGIEGGNVNVFAFDGSRIYAGLNSGGIYTSDNDGTTWTYRGQDLNYDVVTSILVKNQFIFAAVSNHIYVSTNKGENWQPADNGLPASFIASLVSSDSFIIAGLYNDVYGSTDNGATWMWRNSFIGSQINSFSVNDSFLIAGTSSGVYFSSDNGISWEERDEGIADKWIGELLTVNDKIFAACPMDYIYVSTNNGLTWSFAGNNISFGIVSITYGDSVLYALRYRGEVYKSSDFGANWELFNYGLDYNHSNHTIEALGNNIYIGNESGVYKFDFEINQWVEKNAGLYGVTISCLSSMENRIYAGTSNGWVYNSLDMGDTWQKSRISSFPSSVLDIGFKGDSIFAISPFEVRRSTDNGLSWELLNLFTTDISCITLKGNNIYIGTFSDGVWISSDGGNSWILSNDGLTDISIMSIASDEINIYAGTFLHGLFISSDNGLHWIRSYIIADNNFVDLIKVVNQQVYVSGSDGIYISSNYGSTWMHRNYHSMTDFAGINNFVFASMYGTGIYRSTDNGNYWDIYTSESPFDHMNSLAVLDTILFAGSEGYGLWSRSLVPTEVKDQQENNPYNFRLSQNFPNPFNPSTKILYSVPENIKGERIRTVIKVYDVLGNELSTPVNEEKAPGTYELKFSGNALPSGVYLYRLTAGGYSATKKMILLK